MLLDKDKADGWLWSFCLGDALGTPCEFDWVGGGKMMRKWNGSMHEEWRLHRIGRYGHMTSCPPGQVSDDSEMLTSLLTVLDTYKGSYSLDGAKAAYIGWGASFCPFMGRNTRALFGGYKLISTYDARFAKTFGNETKKENTRPNGALMRCGPLALLPTKEVMHEAAVQDTSLTNPNRFSVKATLIYLDILFDLLRNVKDDWKRRVRDQLMAIKDDPYFKDLSQALQDALEPTFKRDLTTCGGWVCHALSASLFHLVQGSTLCQALTHLIEAGGDTDTNAAICAGLLGARDGYETLVKDPWFATNVKVVQECPQAVYKGDPLPPDTPLTSIPFVPRPSIYTPGHAAVCLDRLFRRLKK